jgi:hypothetical protein
MSWRLVHNNYSVISAHDWIHTNRCVPSILHQFLIQWINDGIMVIHIDASTYIALIDAMADWQHGSGQCLLKKDLSSYDFLSITKDGFVPMSVQRASEAWLSNIVFQWVCKRMLSSYNIIWNNISLIRTIWRKYKSYDKVSHRRIL